jgi:hypothetical protein
VLPYYSLLASINNLNKNAFDIFLRLLRKPSYATSKNISKTERQRSNEQLIKQREDRFLRWYLQYQHYYFVSFVHEINFPAAIIVQGKHHSTSPLVFEAVYLLIYRKP